MPITYNIKLISKAELTTGTGSITFPSEKSGAEEDRREAEPGGLLEHRQEQGGVRRER